ncbi:MAG TPA: glycosyltransferase [Luteibaculaceae bacterium]|nr:glycosyltransferase [Luteibaculaceae bacterium]
MNQNRPLLFVLPRWYPTALDQMLGLFVVQHNKALQRHFEVVVIYLHQGTTARPDEWSTEDGIPVYRSYLVNKTGILGPLINPFRYVIRHLQLIVFVAKRHKWPTAFLVQVGGRTLVAPFLCKCFVGIPYFVLEHWSRYLPVNHAFFQSPIKKKILQFLVRRSNSLAAVTQALLNGMGQLGISHPTSVIIPNAIDNQRFAITPYAKRPYLTFLNVGCFDEKAKNNAGLLRAFKQFQAKYPDSKLVMVGTGVDFETTKRMAQELDLAPNHVEFKGELSGDELVQCYQSCTALVIFSHYETQGIVVLEALSCGRPVVGSNVGGLPEIIKKPWGLLVADGDEHQLVLAFEQLMANQDDFLQGAEEGRQWVIDNFSIEAISNKLQQWILTNLNSA